MRDEERDAARGRRGDAEIRKDPSVDDQASAPRLRVSSSPRPSASSLILHPLSLRRRRVSLIGTSFEDEARSRGFKLIAGVDEVGRGALAGPVVAAAVILNPEAPLPFGLDDSKKLTREQRERIGEELRQSALAYSVGLVAPEEIDRINILEATRRAMLDALQQLNPCADFVLIDALQLKECHLPQRAIIRGDSVSASIAAASVIAKTHRDALMRELHEVYPHYNFARHVGYGTREHRAALQLHGACPIHRKSFHGVLTEGMRDEG